MGWNTQHTAAVHFDNCLVPIDNLVGNEGDGFKIAMAGLDGGRVNMRLVRLEVRESFRVSEIVL